MKDEIYVWIAIVVAIVSVAVYLRILYQPPISLSLSSSAILPSRLYPFEVVKLPVTVSNTGSIGIENHRNFCKRKARFNLSRYAASRQAGLFCL